MSSFDYILHIFIVMQNQNIPKAEDNKITTTQADELDMFDILTKIIVVA